MNEIPQTPSKQHERLYLDTNLARLDTTLPWSNEPARNVFSEYQL